LNRSYREEKIGSDVSDSRVFAGDCQSPEKLSFFIETGKRFPDTAKSPAYIGKSPGNQKKEYIVHFLIFL
jgi:hypothetical protein